MGFIPKNGPQWGLQITLLFFIFVSCLAELPTEINAFMDKLFENDECEEFVSGDFTSVATTDCEPYSCDFPRQICQRPSATPSDKAANQCRDVPTKCLTAANGGVPVGPPRFRPTTPPPPPPPSIFAKPLGGLGQGGFTDGPPRPIDPTAICSMGPPSASRFCGFQLKYTYNKETLQCDQFWFPGCPTAETNSNLFEDYQQCQKVAEMCRPTPPPFRPIPMPVPTIAPPPPPPPPPAPAPTPPSPIPGGIPFLGSGTGVGTPMGGTGMAGGDGEDVNLFGFIQKGISAAQAIKQGGPQSKEAASAAAGQILSQFTGFDLNNFGGNFGNFFGG